MGKRIVVLSDGTGNSAAKVWRTNVSRLFQRSTEKARSDCGLLMVSALRPSAAGVTERALGVAESEMSWDCTSAAATTNPARTTTNSKSRTQSSRRHP